MSTPQKEKGASTGTSSGPTASLLPYPHGHEPLRAELHGPERLEALARELALACRSARVIPGLPLLRRFRANSRALHEAHACLVKAYRGHEPLGTDAEWFLDNYHIITDALREIRTDLPEGYYHRLPKLTSGCLADYPRVYALALELIAHCDSGLDETQITHFVQAYQGVCPLSIGELWAVPTMLRLGLVENLRRLAEQVLRARADRHEAHSWAERCLPAANGPRPDRVAFPPPPEDCSDLFLVHLRDYLHTQRPADFGAVEWLEGCMGERGRGHGEVLRREQQRQAANQVSIGNAVTSLRLLSAVDWTAFFEHTSTVEALLRQDPAGTYPAQDFTTRSLCRETVERLARGSRHSEQAVAQLTLDLARRGTPGPGSPRDQAVYYLLGEGRRELEARIGYRPRWRERFLDALLAHARLVYFAGLALATAFVLTLLLGFANVFTPGGAAWPWVLLGLALLLPASEVAVGLINRLVVGLVPPRVLPKLAFRDGIPPTCPTFMVIPSLLVRPESTANLLHNLEIHYLSSLDPQLWFALLTDFADAATEHRADDEVNLRAAREGIRALNERHCPGGPDRFFLFHRRRQWNPVQGCWMGWERKRGKLAEFNRLLRGDRDTSFTSVEGDTAGLPRVRFVITLDADTQLPRETAQRLVATLAHPLNQPYFDPVRRRVTAGYGILQPRISLSLRGTRKSLFARLYAASAGLDPYTTAVSDVYMDLFGLGSFTGKGIYDLDAFEAAVGRTFPDNRILSHDLIEGNYARCGLVTDIELLDEFPASYPAYAWREHRWVRGDWQILPWLFRWVRTPQGERVRNPLPAVERWKIFDNLRRSLVPPALVLLLALGWTVLPGSPWLWTCTALAVLAWPLVLECGAFFTRTFWMAFQDRNWSGIPDGLGATASQALLGGIFLADQARLLVDAILRTLGRLFHSRRNLLEWETAAAAEQRLKASFAGYWRNHWPSPATSLVFGAALAWFRPDALPAAAPFLLAWLLAPAVAFGVSRPRRSAPAELGVAEERYLRRLARRTWSFFETFVGAEDHWLPPDNYQEDPKGELAHRTSPTNVGLYLLANVAAHDFGFLSLPALLQRLEKTFDTLDQLERSHGHFYNWYDTRSLRPLQPIYLSTVDSGNLLGCLLAFKHGLLEKGEEPIAAAAVLRGLSDTLDLAEGTFRALERPGHPAESGPFQDLENDLHEIRKLLENSAPEQAGDDGWLRRLEAGAARVNEQVARLARVVAETPEDLGRWAEAFACLVGQRRDELKHVADSADALRGRCRRLAERADAFATAIDFRLLYNTQRNLFSVGYNLSLGRLDGSHYDLLASEACLTSFLAVARGDAPKRHWFQLGRPLTRVAGSVALVSWGGTMFEYLMPRLLLAALPDTLLDQSQRAAVARQIEYGRQRRVPWGISESAFSTVDTGLNYQYQAFGVPGLGLKRGLVKDLVVAPYASALAVGIAPRAVVANFERLTREGARGAYGYYESIDYTKERLPPGTRSVVVKCFMAHHQGMAFVALANCLLHDRMPRRLLAEPMVRATELLLQERVPPGGPLLQPHGDEVALHPAAAANVYGMSRRLTTPHTVHPRTQLISSGPYSVMLTNAGSGRSVCDTLDVSRWREDGTCDDWGQFCYLRDLRTGRTWSAGYQPLRLEPDEYEVIYSTDKAEFRRVDGRIETHLEVTVSPESRSEVRRLTLTNRDSQPHDLELTSYVEVVLTPHAADLAHPAFGKLFLETEYLAAEGALLCRRRPRSPEQKPVWAVHVLAVDEHAAGPIQYETDRARFLGRGRTPANPAALDRGATLSGTVGPVLDPIFSLRRRVRVAPESSVRVAFTTAVADSREEAVTLADRFHDFHGVTRVFELAWAHSQLELRHLHLTAEEAHLFQRLAAYALFSGPRLRAAAQVLTANRQGTHALWRYGISGDNPIVLVRIDQAEKLELVRQLLSAHTYWRLKGLRVDLVLLNEFESGYFEDLHKELQALVRASDDRSLEDKPGGVFLRKAPQMPREDLVLLQASARCVLLARHGPLANQLSRLEQAAPPPLPPIRPPARVATRESPPVQPRNGHAPDLLFPNGTGGFTPDGKEYLVQVGGGPEPWARLPPAPWVNVVANPSCGFLVSESGGGYTWAGNSQTNRLTPWNNDPVCDPPGEVVYLRDEATGDVWTPTPLPLGGGDSGQVRHGQGYSLFEQRGHGLEQQLLLFVPPEDPVKILRLTVRNSGPLPRRLTATFYVEWVLGTVRDQAAQNVITEIDEASGALVARNPFNTDFASRVAFAHVNARPLAHTADRTEFLGRNGSVSAPVALRRTGLSGTTGPGLDPCAALQVSLDLKRGEERTLLFFLGQAEGVGEVKALLDRYRDPARVEAAFRDVRAFWDHTLGAVQVRTPDQALDLLLNRWLVYQVLSCRMWGRSAFYQSGGAYGFRDQLQDALGLLYGAPQEARTHILRASGRQFVEGDVQHWWHPPEGAGVRTHFSDDFLWLPYAVSRYVEVTGDESFLEESLPYLQAPPLRPDQEDDYRVPETAAEKGTVYEHCVRALDHGLRFGSHGLPLMGTGDWNDGMNRVGSGGRGESVWNAWFLLTLLPPFAERAQARGDGERAQRYRDTVERLRTAVEEQGWDGQWYRRAYFDDGTPLGSAQNDECQIDSLPQSWAVLSGAASSERARRAMASLEQRLVLPDYRVILLFTPAFDHGPLEPGYVKGYLPGIRENGGQYTHAAAWVVQALALLGQASRAAQLLGFLNPINHTRTPEQVRLYRVEPYVLAGDVAGQTPDTGRGGWTWYTGSAGWIYRVALETMLGFHKQGNGLRIDPRVPAEWPSFEITYRFQTTTYTIRVENPRGVEQGVQSLAVDGKPVAADSIDLTDDGRTHTVLVRLG